jgi:hypothetical protein
VGSGLAAFSGIICLLFVPKLDQDCIQEEDLKFRAYLEEHGYDTSKMGLPLDKDPEGVATVKASDLSVGAEVPVVKKGKSWFKKVTAVAP